MAAEKNNRYAAKYDDTVDELVEDLLDWAENAKDIHFSGWTRKHKKTRPWLHELAKSYPQIAEAKEEAAELLARKILNTSFYGGGNANVGMQYLPVYDKDFRDLLKWKAEIAKEQPVKEDSKGVFNEWKDAQLKETPKE